MYLIKEPPETLFPWGVWFFRHEEASKCQQFSQEPRWFSCSDKCGTLAALALEASEWHLAGSHGPGQVQISHSYNLFKITDTIFRRADHPCKLLCRSRSSSLLVFTLNSPGKQGKLISALQRRTRRLTGWVHTASSRSRPSGKARPFSAPPSYLL